MATQKIVIEVAMDTPEKRAKAMKIAVGFRGVDAASIGGDNKDQLAVVGAVDPVALTKRLRERLYRKKLCKCIYLSLPCQKGKGSAQIVSVGAPDKKEDEKKPETVAYCFPGGVPPLQVYEVREPNPGGCCIQ